MSTINFAQMTSKKLNALLATASDEDKILIEKELQARQKAIDELDNEPVGGYANPDVVESEISDSEKEMIKDAESNNGKRQAAPKMTEEERMALIESLKANVIGHRCEVLPAGKPDWIGGVITGVMNDKRAVNILLTIKTDNGRTIHKMHNAETLRVSDEVVEIVKARAGRKTQSKEKTPWDTMGEDIAAAAANVGKVCTFDINGVTTTGRVATITADKRSKMVLYRINVVEGETTRVAYKSSKAAITFNELDEEGQKIYDAFMKRRESAPQPKTLSEKIAQAELDLQKAEERAAVAAAKVATLKETIEKLKAEAESVIDAAQAAEESEPVADELA